MTERVLVIGDYRQTLTVARSLRHAGWEIIAGVVDPAVSHVLRSRAVASIWRHPPVSSDRFAPALHVAIARYQPRVVFPVGDGELAQIVPMREELAAPVVAPDRRVVEVCQDKALLLERAAAVDVPFSASRVAGSIIELRAMASEIGYPVIVKAGDPHHRLLKSKGIVCDNAIALDALIGDWPEGHSTLLVQKYFEGQRHNVYLAAEEGNVLGSVEVVINRTDRLDDTGYAVDGATVEPLARLSEYTAALVSELKYSGVGCVQYLVREDGEVSLLELNPRLGANYAVAAAAGLDLAVLGVDLALGLTPPAIPAPRVGVRYAWTTGDLRGLVRALRRREIGLGGAVRWSSQAMITAISADAHITWSWRDPRPTLSVLHAEFVRPLLRRLLSSRG